MERELKIIENELMPVYETSTGEKVVDGRELHSVLQSKQDFSTWTKARLKECDAIEKEDYELFHNSVEQMSGTKHRIDYIIKLDTAKEMAMLERNEKGKQVRRYFIQVEKKYKQGGLESLSPELRAVIVVDRRITKAEKRLDRLEYDIPPVWL